MLETIVASTSNACSPMLEIIVASRSNACPLSPPDKVHVFPKVPKFSPDSGILIGHCVHRHIFVY